MKEEGIVLKTSHAFVFVAQRLFVTPFSCCEQTGRCVPGAEAERSWLLSELRRAEKPRVRRQAPDAQRRPQQW